MQSFLTRSFALACFVLATSLSYVAPPRAAACGGFFCSQSTGGAPIDQAGEDVAYVVEGDGTLTMIVRIVYSGASTSFAWVLPVPVAPTSIEIGPDALFTQLAPATSPTFTTMFPRTEGTCAEPSCTYPSYSSGCGCLFAQASPTSASVDSGFAAADASARDGGSVVVVGMETVGAYETVVLSAGSAEELHTWLDDNGYDLPATAIPLIAEYVAEHQLFVALRLRAGAGNDAIQPIMLRIPTASPCLPIRLTAIATVPGLPIRAYILGDTPFVPSNFSVLDPPLEPSLFSSPSQWPSVWSAAIDAVGGHAWVRDFTGPPPPISLAVPSLDGMRTATPGGFFSFVLNVARYPRTAVIAIAPGFLELEAGADLGEYVDRCTLGGSCPTPLRWDADGFVTALHDQVRVPRARLESQFAAHTTLTRLYTSLDADEMTLDPEFRAEPGIGGQSQSHTGTQVTECAPNVFIEGAAQRWDFSDGTSVRTREADPTLDANTACIRRGATGARSSSCAASQGEQRAGLAVGLGMLAAATYLGRRRWRR